MSGGSGATLDPQHSVGIGHREDVPGIDKRQHADGGYGGGRFKVELQRKARVRPEEIIHYF